MKTALKVLTIAIKAITIIMTMIGVIATIIVAIVGPIYVNHIYEVVDAFVEYGDFDPDDEVQDLAIKVQAFSMTMDDPRVKQNKFINVVAHGVGRFASFVANL